MGFGHARQCHVCFTGPIGGSEKHARPALHAKAAFSGVAGCIPMYFGFASGDFETWCLHTYPTNRAGAMGMPAGLADTVGDKSGLATEGEAHSTTHTPALVAFNHLQDLHQRSALTKPQSDKETTRPASRCV